MEYGFRKKNREDIFEYRFRKEERKRSHQKGDKMECVRKFNEMSFWKKGGLT